jgi:hypothetical protein
MRKFIATLAVGGFMFFGSADDAQAQNLTFNDGLVNVTVGDVTILQDVNVAVAATVVAQLCGINVSNVQVALLARATQVDRSGRTATICRSEDGPVRIVQN